MEELVMFLQGKKTYLVSAAMVVHAVFITGWQLGDWNSAYQEVLTALGLSALRAGIAKQ